MLKITCLTASFSILTTWWKLLFSSWKTSQVLTIGNLLVRLDDNFNAAIYHWIIKIYNEIVDKL